ncbi:sucrose-6-phosphate hydrolase SacC (GH32 family) [Peteryoungia aggregata LMG 23059]|uniref:Sucrose-6-phosphate hydrolase SacC (GH32 family) n=1 Tax=Peteryoungia aggregata LMG 23059 TaxID=1368425 RepID=A0ABU0G5D4_9HYPH|nr:sucrose-6-phosphate hydrolase SacC (GH32 family) [Peteryoungia aggregata LMG 23059]
MTVWPDKRDGAFSGSAITRTDGLGIRVFFTEKITDRIPEQDIQLTATSAYLFSAGAAEVLLPRRPDGEDLPFDFRDPYVFRGPDGVWKMLLGSQSAQDGVVLSSEKEDNTAAGGWTYVGKLYTETRCETSALECRCLPPVNGDHRDPTTRWALIYGLMNGEDKDTGRRDLTMVFWISSPTADGLPGPSGSRVSNLCGH